MDTTLRMMLLELPNVAVALWVLWQQNKTIRFLLANNEALIKQLMALHPPQDEPGPRS